MQYKNEATYLLINEGILKILGFIEDFIAMRCTKSTGLL